mmetsp:Transcript_32411/g.85056  ORF Transcript_32411/g.85056 Transcript_32411/m.85056 type:complete len:290 (-) Transcript_32411:243-1112(-)
MPKRATHTFESEKDGVQDAALGLQYCMCCGESVLILGPNVALADLPRRRTDGAIVLERETTIYKLNSKARETKVIKREGGYERQHRFGCWNCGVLLGYRAEDSEDAPLTYILSDATGMQADLYLQMFQVPQCIQETGKLSVRIALEVLCGQTKRALRAVEAEHVGVSVTAPAREGLANAELLDYMQKILAVQRSELQLSRGWSAQTKFLLVSGLKAVDIFKKLKAAVELDAPVDAATAAQADPNGEFSGQQQFFTAGAASFAARRAWETSEDVDELAEAPSKKQQGFIK